MPNEMQELIEVAEEIVGDKGRFLSTHVRLHKAISAARKASEGGWIEIKNNHYPVGEDHLLIVRGPEELKMQCVGYWNRLMKAWVVGGQRMDGLDVTHYRELDWPSPPLSVENPKEGK
jgi:hypothetical protein